MTAARSWRRWSRKTPAWSPPPRGEPVEILHTREVIDAIRSLPQAQREVVAAVDVAGFGYSEAADQLQIPVGTVMSRLHRGRAPPRPPTRWPRRTPVGTRWATSA